MSWAPRTTEPRPCRPVVKDAGQPARTNLGEPSCGIRKRLMKLNAGLKRLAVVQSVSCVRLFVTTWTAVPQASLTFTVSQSLFRLISIESVKPFNHPGWTSVSPYGSPFYTVIISISISVDLRVEDQ